MVKTRKVQIGWLHFSDDHQRYISVRLQKGGGTREVDVPLNADIQQIIQIAEEIFFSNGRCIFGALEDMEVALANFKCETLRISTPEGDPFTLQHYIHQCKTTRVRLYLKSKKKTFPERQASHSGVLDQVVKDEESDLLVPVFPENERELNGDQLLGTSIEREEIRKAQDQEFAQSLALDKRKEEKKRLVLTAMGFERPSSIVFIPLGNTKESRLPSVSTCIPQLSIPNYILEDFDNFKKQSNFAVLGSMEFGQP